MQLLQNNDFNCIGIIATHCDNSKLCVAENEAITFDLDDIYCGYGTLISGLISEVDTYIEAKRLCDLNPQCTTPPVTPNNYENKYKLVYGSFFESQCGKTITFQGIKKILAYYTYARYVVINGYNDTPTGIVQKNSDFSLPTPLVELQAFSEKYRDMGRTLSKNSKSFICYSEMIEGYPCKNTLCLCGQKECGKSSNTKGFGVRSNVISKNYGV